MIDFSVWIFQLVVVLLSVFIQSGIIVWGLLVLGSIMYVLVLATNVKFWFFLVQEISLRGFMLRVFLWDYIPRGVTVLALFLKMAVPPFHGWFIVLLDKLSWRRCIMFLTAIKVVPFYLVLNCFDFSVFHLCWIRGLLSSLLLLVLLRQRKVVFFSSNRIINLLLLLGYQNIFKRFVLFVVYRSFLVLSFLLRFIWFSGVREGIGFLFLVVLIGIPGLLIFFVKWLMFIAYSYGVVYLLGFMLLFLVNLIGYFRLLLLLFFSRKVRGGYKFWFTGGVTILSWRIRVWFIFS